MLDSAGLASPLTDRINTAFNKSPYLAKNQVKFMTNEGYVRLEGKVGSFFQKQMAQEIVRRLDGVQCIENQLQVNWDKI